MSRVVEDALFMVGDARDFLDREEDLLHKLLDKLETGKVTFVAARLAVHLDFVAAHKDLTDWENRLSPDALAAGFKHLHPQLSLRIVAPLPEVIA